MISLRMRAEDLTKVRLARSPLYEVTGSLRTLGDPARHFVHQRWIAEARREITGLDLTVALALTCRPGWLPDFLLLPPSGWDTDFGAELDQLLATPAAAVRSALEELAPAAALPPALRPLHADPARELPRLADTLARYRRLVIEPSQPRMNAVLDAEFTRLATSLATGGTAAAFDRLHPDVRYTAGRLDIDLARHSGEKDLPGNTGLLLVPTVFAWPTPFVVLNEPYRPTLAYPPHGVASVWRNPGDAEYDLPLGELIGRSRALLLLQLDLPRSTTQLAATVGLTAPAVSQHLSVLRRNALVTSQRRGREVLYVRTRLASQLLATVDQSATG
ncbi:ArsR/SmtB family transcription factor [Crossiella sp. CA198]|uniref:ArsR/SmtB family transcription factor n=1 Tax=Crossiella sp. CA198 TaxID=3455607 RepID=UPI003F8D4D0B